MMVAFAARAIPAISNSSTSASTLSRLRSTIVTRDEPGVTVSPGSTWREMTTPSIGAMIRYLAASASSRSTAALAASRRATAAACSSSRLSAACGALPVGAGEDSVQLEAGSQETKAGLGLDQPKMGLPKRGLHVVGPKLHEQVALADGHLLTRRHVDDRPQDLRADSDLGAGIGDDSPLSDDPAG